MKKAAIYTRISDDPEGLALGITRQEEDCRARAARDNYQVIAVYPENDRGASTRSKKPRPKYDELLAAIRAGEINVVIAYSNSRLTRRPLEFEGLIQLHEQTGVRFLTVVSGDDDLATADGRMMARMKAAVDAAEAERLAERVTRAARQRAELGRGHGGGRPYGWRSDDRTKLDPAEHAVHLELAPRLLAGESIRSITADLNARRIPTATGAPWTPTTLRIMMTNWRLAGIRVYKGEIVGRGDWEPSLPELLVRQLRRLILDPNRRISTTNVRKNLLTGLALCAGGCNGTVAAKVVVQKDRPPRPRYLCTDCGIYRSQEPIDLYVETYLKQLLRQYKPTPDPGADPAAEQEAAEIKERIASTIERFTSSDAVSAQQLEEILRGLNRRLAQAEARALPPRPMAPILAGLTGEDPEIGWDALPLDRKRAVIDALVTVKIHRTLRGKRGFAPESVEISRR